MAPTASSTIDNIAIGPNTRASGAFTTLTSNNAVTFTANTASSSTGTGSLVVTGGIGASGTIYAGAFNGNLTGTLQTAAQPNITSTGGLTAPQLILSPGTGIGVIRRSAVNGSNGVRIQGNAADGYPNDANAGAYIQLSGGAIGDTYEGNVDIVAYGGNVDANRNQIRFSNRLAANTVTERMRIDKDGNVGIGSPGPTAKLDVYDSASASTADLFVVRDYLGGGSDKTRLIIKNGGNVGIGTANPSWPLTVKSGSSGTVATFLYDGAFAGTSEANIGLRWYNGGNASDIPQVKLRGYGTSNYTGNFGIDVLVGGTYPNGFAERFTIQGTTGNVGIGIASPNGLLNLKGSNGQLVLTNGNTSGGVKLTATDVNFTANGYLAFEGYANEYGRFDAGGNLLLGSSTSPNHATTGIFITGSSNRGVSWAPTSDTHYIRLEPAVIDGLTINGYSGVAFARGSRTNSTWEVSARFDGSGNLTVGNPTAFGRISAVKSGKATIAGIDTAAYAQGVGGTLDLGGNYRASGDYTAFVRIAAEKTNATNTDYGYDMGFYVTTNNGATMGTKALTIASSGNVGIGSTTPAGILDVGDNRLSSQTYLRNNGNYGGGGGGQTTFNMIFGGMPIAIINNTGTGQRDGQFRLLDENVTKVNIVANSARGGPTYFNGGNVGIGIEDPRTLLQVAVPSQNYVSFGNTSYGAGDWYGIHVGYCEGGNTFYRKHMLAYEALPDGAARGNLHLLVNTTYGSASATIADSKLMISGTTGNVGIGNTNPGYKLDVTGVIRSGGVELSRVHTDIMAMWRTADLQGYTTHAADGGSVGYTWDNGMVLVDTSVGSHNWDIGKINLSPGVYQLVIVWRPSPTAHGWSNFGTNSNGHDLRLQSDAGWGAFNTYLSVSALSINKDLGYSITYASGIYTVASQTTYRIGMGTQPYNGGGYKYYVEAAYLMRLN